MTLPSKILFLDFDGVMSNFRTGLAYGEFLLDSFDPVGARILNKICESTGAKIVCTSTRAYNSPLRWKALKPIFEESGLDIRNIHADWSCNEGFNKYTREDHIRMWLDKHPEVKHYAIIDDEKVDLPHLVLINDFGGITTENVTQIADCLDVDEMVFYRYSQLQGAFNRGQLRLPYGRIDRDINDSINALTPPELE